MQVLRADRPPKDALWDVDRIFLLHMFRDGLRERKEDLPEGSKRDEAKH